MAKGSAPATPDYQGAAETQAQSSLQNINTQTASNRPNVTTPWGSLSWKNTGTLTKPDWSGTVTLTPSEQAALDSQQGIQAGQSDLAHSLLNKEMGQVSGVPGTAPLATGISKDPSMLNQDTTNAVWDQFQNMQMPLLKQQKEQNQSQLEAQGLRPGDEAYKTSTGNLDRAQFGEEQTAADQALLAGEQEGSTLFGENMAKTGFNNSLIPQNISNEAAETGLSQEKQAFDANLMNSILHGNQVSMPAFPGASPAGMAQPIQSLDAATNMYGSNLNAYNAQSANSNAMMGAGMSALETYMMYAAMTA